MDLRAFKEYEGLYQNLRIGDGDDTTWDPSKPPPPPSPPSPTSNKPTKTRVDSMTSTHTPDKGTAQMPAEQLLFHLLHLSKITMDTLSTYLCTEVLIRDLSSQNRSTFTLTQNLSNAATLLLEMKGVLADVRANLEKCSESHNVWLYKPCYANLMRGAEKMCEAVGWIPDPAVVQMLPERNSLVNVNRLWVECKELQEGFRISGGVWEEGWKECWGFVEYRPVPPMQPKERTS